MKRRILCSVLLLISCIGVSQEANKTIKDSVASELKLTAAIDLVYPYFWRGLRYTGNKVAFQPYINYGFTDKLSVELWATTNFSDAADAYDEFDWIISYQISPVINITLADYYWPATSKNTDWEKSNYFDYSFGSSQTIDLIFLFDFSKKAVPIDFTWSTFIGGNDFRGDKDNRSRAFSSFAEVGYTHSFEKLGIDVRSFVGASVFNEGGYYGTDATGDSGFTFTNIGLNIAKKIAITKNYSVPLFVKYIYNDYGIQEFDSEGNLTKTVKNFFSCGLTFTLL